MLLRYAFLRYCYAIAVTMRIMKMAKKSMMLAMMSRRGAMSARRYGAR